MPWLAVARAKIYDNYGLMLHVSLHGELCPGNAITKYDVRIYINVKNVISYFT